MALMLAYNGVPTPTWMREGCTCSSHGLDSYPDPATVWDCPQDGIEADAWMAGVRDAQEALAALLADAALSDPPGTVAG